MLTAAARIGGATQRPSPYRRTAIAGVPFVLCWLYWITNQFYVLDSGAAQPADLLMAVLIGVAVARYMGSFPRADGLYFAIALFLLYVACINLFWLSMYPGEVDVLWPPSESLMVWSTVYYVYNILAMMSVIVVANEDYAKFVAVARFGLCCALVIELGAVVLHGAGRFRGIGTFNNPNQLGYWALLVASSWLVMKGTDRLTRADASVLAVAVYLTAVSLSKAAIFSMLLLLALAAAFQRSSIRLAASVGVLFVSIASVVTLAPDQTQRGLEAMASGGLVAKMEHRMDGLGVQSDDSLEGRGYARLWQYPQYLIFGAGDGATWRFATGVKEFHSTLGMLVFGYGVVGLSLFFTMMAGIFRGALRRHVLYAAPLFIYGLTHNGLRFTMLWIFFGLVVAGARERGRLRWAG